MPQIDITLTWMPPFTSSTAECTDKNGNPYDWIYEVAWNQGSMPAGKGIYIIQNDASKRVYAGKAEAGVAKRFKGRSKALREYRLSTRRLNPVANYTVYVASVASTDRRNGISIAEKWLIRVLRNADEANTTQYLQNIQEIRPPYTAPPQGLSITNGGSVPLGLPASITYVGGAAI